MPLRELFEFDAYRLDTEDRLPLRDGVPLPLDPKVLETLLRWIRHLGGGCSGRAVR